MRKSRIKGVYSPWINAQLSEAMHERDYYHRKALKTKCVNHWSRNKELKNCVNKETRDVNRNTILSLLPKPNLIQVHCGKL